ncbi:MAG: hypothetical protein IPL71_20865 [Anaerolineales bacterium]|uniref:hypothetical protein n=1 Tax=Candidatus Villigracilis proximus TaxID=3140683 RepID=UPI003135904E|nr:hypothetical protein [Anaerolineales bacterium]
MDLLISRHRLRANRRFTQPGSFQTYLISQTLTRGWKRTLPAALAPLISDGPIILICLLLLSQVPDWLKRFLHIARRTVYFVSGLWHIQKPGKTSTCLFLWLKQKPVKVC